MPTQKEEWKESYPLKTFKGQTREELTSFIESLLLAERASTLKTIESMEHFGGCFYKIIISDVWKETKTT